ncbi:MAG: class I SAM-dependent methyltransferase [Candidatus Eiseniibacteriota bacterium]
MSGSQELPVEFTNRLHQLACSYLASGDPYLQSGFGGGAERWRAEREPILTPLTDDGDLLDIGCANGLLLEDLVAWGAERGAKFTPYGLDHSAELLELARSRLHRFADHFFAGNAWSWQPPRRFRYVYSLADAVPPDYLRAYVGRLLKSFVAPRGTLIFGSYGSRSRAIAPLDLAAILSDFGYQVAGTTAAGVGPIVRFAWLDGPAI